MKKTLFTCLFGFTALGLFAQQHPTHCGSEYIKNQMIAQHPEFKDVLNEIELFTQNYVIQQQQSKKTRATIYRIPVVVHIIHNGESVGSGANISTTQINSQIATLNKDYRLKNTDSLKPTHAFWGATDDCEIEFCLAMLDPQGHATNGIDRVDGGSSSYDYSDLENTIKPNTIWDHTKYLNIWVATFGGSASGLLGYATPPGAWADVDGVVVGTTNFGSVGNVSAPYNKGRTATHEIGHFFNLIHTWGDATCGNDLVSDTPPAYEANFGCPTFPHNGNNSCGANSNGEMYMNYMDYTDDGCMVMFTTGQKNRMRAVLGSGGPRNSLTISNGCTWPTGVTEVTNTPTINVFPNPTNDHFYVSNKETDFGKDFSFKIFNAIGQDVTSLVSISKETESRLSVNTKLMPNGTYFVKINSNSITITKSISIAH